MAPSATPSPYAERVLDAVARVPYGQVVTYGEVATTVGAGGPRQVGQVLARYGGGVPWHRVVRADGSPPPGLRDEALARLAAEGIPLRAGRPGGSVDRVDLANLRSSTRHFRSAGDRNRGG